MMTRRLDPPVRGLKIAGALLGATALAASGWQHWRKPGLVAGMTFGAGLGWIVAWLAVRRLFRD